MQINHDLYVQSNERFNMQCYYLIVLTLTLQFIHARSLAIWIHQLILRLVGLTQSARRKTLQTHQRHMLTLLTVNLRMSSVLHVQCSTHKILLIFQLPRFIFSFILLSLTLQFLTMCSIYVICMDI